MPGNHPSKILRHAWWGHEQALAWVADRSLDRVNTAYREWRDRYYEYPQLSDWDSKPPLIWDWRSPVAELDGAAQALRRKCENGALRGTGREGASRPRREIAPLQWPDLMLVDIAGVTGGPQLYDRGADPLATMNGRAEPLFRDVLFSVDEILTVFPLSLEAKGPVETVEPAEVAEPAKLAGLTEIAEPATPKVLVEAIEPVDVAKPATPPAQTRMQPPLETAATLLHIYPKGRGSDNYNVMLDKLAGYHLIVGRSTLVRALRMLGPNWRLEPHYLRMLGSDWQPEPH